MGNPFSQATDRPFGIQAMSAGVRPAPGIPELPGASPPDMWYDFTDITQLFQDTGHSNPITANGQEVLGITNKGAAGAAQDIAADITNGPIYTTGGLNSQSFGQYTRARAESLDTIGSTFDWPAAQARCSLIVGRFVAAGGVFQTAYGGDQDGAELVAHHYEDTVGSFSRLVNESNSTGTWVSPVDDFAAIGTKQANGVFEARINTEDNDHAGSGSVPASRLNFGIRLGDLSGVSEGNEHWNGRIYEMAQWCSGGIPTLDELEAYVTAKYTLAWV